MHSLVPLTLAAALAAPAAAAPTQAGDTVVLYSAGVESMLAHPKDAGLAEAVQEMAPPLIGLLELADVRVNPELVTFVHGALTRPLCFRIGQDEMGRPNAQLAVRYDDVAEARRAADWVIDQMGQTGIQFMRPPEGTTKAVAMTPAGPASVDATAGPSGPRLAIAMGAAVDETFQFDDTGLPDGVAPTSYVRFDGARLGAMIRPIVSSLGVEMPIAPMLLLEAFGAPDSPVITYATGTREGRGLAVARSIGGAAAGRRSGTLVETPLGPEDFARIPADASWARMAQWRPAAYLSQLDRVQPGMADGVIAQMRGMTGIDLRADLLEHIGPTVSAYTSRTTGGGLFSGVLLLESDDSESVRSSVETLWTIVNPILAAQAEGRVDVRGWQVGDVDCATVVFPGLPIPIEPSFAAADGVVVCAMSRTALRAAVEQLGAETGLRQSTRLAGIRDKTFEGLAGFGFYDTPRFVLDGYGSLAVGAAAIGNLMHEPGAGGDLFDQVLPTPRVFASRVRPSVSFVRIKGDDVVETTSRDASCLVRTSACLGGPLAESQMLALGVPIIASIAIPNLLSARQSANENAAIATLRSLAAAQQQVQIMTAIDTDRDGVGEYAFLAELCGTARLRTSGGDGGVVLGAETLNPPFLPMSLSPTEGPTGDGVTVRSGYVFQVWLPDANGNGATETLGNGAGDAPTTDADRSEIEFCVYAWPMDVGKTGQRVFCVSHTGDVLFFANERDQYSGLPGIGKTPAFDAALSRATTNGWTLARDSVGLIEGADGNVWQMIGY